jgi:hypothetical protein
MNILQRIRDWLIGQPEPIAYVATYRLTDIQAVNTGLAEGVIRRMGTNNLDLWLAQLNRTRRAEIQFAEAEDIERRPRAEVRRLVISEIERRKQTAQQ